MVKRNEFTTFEIKEKLKFKRERLKEWKKEKFILPSIKKADGVGTKNLYSLRDCYRIKLMELLVRRGFSRERASALCYGFVPPEPIDQNFDIIGYVIPMWDKDDRVQRRDSEDPKTGQHVVYTDESRNMEAGEYTFHPVYEGEELNMEEYENCTDILFVNLKKIREKVDKALL